MADRAPAAERCCTPLTTFAIGSSSCVLDVARSGYLRVHVAGLGPGSVMTWWEQQLQTFSLPKSGEHQFYMSLLISMRCSGSNKLGRQREKGEAECPVWSICVHVSVHVYECTHVCMQTYTLMLIYSSPSTGGFTSAHLGPHCPTFLPGTGGKGCEVSPCCFLRPPLEMCLPPKSSEIAIVPCGDAGSNLGLILGILHFMSCGCVCELCM